VSLCGATAVSRAGSSILSTIGLPQFATHDKQAYIDLAATLAQDSAKLATLRSSLRQQMTASQLMDASAFVRDVESAYLRMWNEVPAAPQSDGGRRGE